MRRKCPPKPGSKAALRNGSPAGGKGPAHVTEPAREAASRKDKPADQKGRRWVDDPGGEGYEIVREMIVCPDCARQLTTKQKLS
jgi:hypothetical protein